MKTLVGNLLEALWTIVGATTFGFLLGMFVYVMIGGGPVFDQPWYPFGLGGPTLFGVFAIAGAAVGWAVGIALVVKRAIRGEEQ